MIETIRENWKRYLISSCVTFVVGFFISLLAQFENITPEAFSNGAIVGILFVSVRAGVKMVMELIVNWYQNK